MTTATPKPRAGNSERCELSEQCDKEYCRCHPRMKPRAGEHTKGPWRDREDGLVFFPGSLGGFSLQNCPSPEANARRITLCVNAFQHVTNGGIEELQKVGGVSELMARAKVCRAQRDLLRERERELVEALAKAADTFRDFAQADQALGKPIRAAASEMAEQASRALLAKARP